MSVTRGGQVTLSSVLLFCPYPQAFFPQLCITAVALPGSEMGETGEAGERFLDNRRIEGTIPEMLEQAIDFVCKNMRTKTIINPRTGRREDRTDYPVTAVREVLLNYINIVIAVSFVAVTVRGIQGDLAMLMFCIPSGMGRALGIINGVYYRAKDRRALERLYAYGLKLSIGVSIIMGILIFVIAPLLTRLYTHNPEFIGLTIFSIRWMAVGLMFDTSIVLHQGYLQSTGSGKASTALIIGERLFLPVAFALVLGMLFGTKGVLASYAVSRIFIIKRTRHIAVCAVSVLRYPAGKSADCQRSGPWMTRSVRANELMTSVCSITRTNEFPPLRLCSLRKWQATS